MRSLFAGVSFQFPDRHQIAFGKYHRRLEATDRAGIFDYYAHIFRDGEGAAGHEVRKVRRRAVSM